MARTGVGASVCFLLVMWFPKTQAGLLDGQPIAGPVDIILSSMAMCPRKMSGKNGLRISDTHYSNVKERPYEFILTTKVDIDFPLADNLTAMMNMAQWTDRGGWRNGAHTLKFANMCSSLSSYASKIWEPLVTNMYKHHQSCPLPALKNGHIVNATVNTRNSGIKDFVYGRWRLDAVMKETNTGDTKGCIRLTLSFAPAVQ